MRPESIAGARRVCEDLANDADGFMTTTSQSRRAALAVLSGGMATGVAGCGFRPMYGRSAASGRADVRAALAQLRVNPIPDRQGQRLRQILRESLASSGEASSFELEVKLAQSIQELGVRRDSTTSRANLIFGATLTLRESGAVAFVDNVRSIVSYNILDDQYGTVASQSDAEDRALRQIGDEITTRLGIFFDRQLAGRR